MKRNRLAPSPLPPGEYHARSRDTSQIAAALNGHADAYPEARCSSDGKWCVFYRNGQAVWECNAVYAAAHFDCERYDAEPKPR